MFDVDIAIWILQIRHDWCLVLQFVLSLCFVSTYLSSEITCEITQS